MKTNSKRTQNELKLSAQMREIDSRPEFSDIPLVGGGGWIVRNAAGAEIVRLGETRRTARKHQNSGNKAKKYLKTKDITFLSAPNDARFGCKSTQIPPWRSESRAFCAKTSRRFRVGRQGQEVGYARLGFSWLPVKTCADLGYVAAGLPRHFFFVFQRPVAA